MKTKIFSLILALVLVGCLTAPVRAAVAPTGTYTAWYWPVQSGGYDSMEWTVLPENDASPDGYFYSNQFSFINGDSGYFGIQTEGATPTGKIAVFSIWQALTAQSPQYSAAFGGEGTGFTARISYNWVPGHSYRLRVARVSGDGNGTWWGAWIKDQSNSVEAYVGQIQVPAGWQKLQNSSIAFSERYSGSLNTCSDIQFSGVEFLNLTVNNGAIGSTSHTNYLANPQQCPGSYSVDVAGGSRQWMGATAPPPIYTAPASPATPPPTHATTTPPAPKQSAAPPATPAPVAASIITATPKPVATQTPAPPTSTAKHQTNSKPILITAAGAIVVMMSLLGYQTWRIRLRRKYLRQHFAYDFDIHGPRIIR